MELLANIDGGSRGNPGPSAIGVVIKNSDDTLRMELGKCIGRATNNEAEYLSLLYALRYANDVYADKLVVHCDSQLVVRQMQGNYATNNTRLLTLRNQAIFMARKLKYFEIIHIPREQNVRADRLVNEALDAEAAQSAVDPEINIADWCRPAKKELAA